MEKEIFKWCFIGCGTLANIVAEEITKPGRHGIVSTYTRRMEQAEEFADKFGAKACKTPEEAILTEGVEGVYVVTPHRSHYAYTKLALELGKPVLCEKAFTVNSKEATEVIRLAEKKELYLAEAMWTWFSPIARQVKKWLDAGEFGEIQECLVDCRSNAKDYAARVTDPNAAGGAMLDMGVYAAYYLYKLFGKPEKITCQGDVHDGIDWSEEMIFHYPNDVQYHALISVDDDVDQRLNLKGEKGSLVVPHLHYADHAEFVNDRGEKKEITAEGGYWNEFRIVAEEIRSGQKESSYVTHEDTLLIMGILDEARKQLGLTYAFES